MAHLQRRLPIDLIFYRLRLTKVPGAFLKNPGDPWLAPFLAACKQADVSTIDYLIRCRDATDGSLSWGLYAALKSNRPAVARLFLERGVPIDRRAITDTKSQECFELLKEHGWAVNDRLEYGNTVLPRIMALKDDKLTRWFLSQGADPTLGPPLHPNYTRDDPVDMIQPATDSDAVMNAAAEHCSPEIVDLLVEHGAGVVSDRGNPLLHTVTSVWLTTSERITMMEHLLALGADVNKHGYVPGSESTWGAPLHGAALWGRLPEVKWLLENGANVCNKNSFGRLPWFDASRGRNDDSGEIIKLMREWEYAHHGTVDGKQEASNELAAAGWNSLDGPERYFP